jgi:hypothetical protein
MIWRLWRSQHTFIPSITALRTFSNGSACGWTGDRLGGELWHAELLDSMARRTASRPPVISEALRHTLKGYLDFRHVFRHAYSFELHWNKMLPLVLDVEKTLRQLEDELERFLKTLEA